MGRKPCCDKVGLKKGPWTAEEDKKLINFILTNGQCCWRALPKLAGLLRCGKSCRLRWTNYLRPDLKRGLLSDYEEKMVIDLHAQLGNRWSKIASHLPGRTDNEIKNNWNTHIKKKLKKMGIDPFTHQLLPSPIDQPPSAALDHDNGDADCLCKELEETMDSVATAMKETESTITSYTSSELDKSASFCVDEVPLVDPKEILIPCDPSSSASSSMTTSSNSVICQNNIFEDLEVADLEWPWDYCNADSGNDIRLWDDDFDWNLNLLIDEGSPGSKSTAATEATLNYSYKIPALDQISLDIIKSALLP